jgi:hypothetical protein
MIGPGGLFGRLRLPEIKTKSGGTASQVHDQTIQIIDMEAFKPFVKSLMTDESLVLKLANGKTTVKAFMTKTPILYSKDIHLAGMAGIKSTITDAEINGDKTFTSTVRVSNPSPWRWISGLSSNMFSLLGEKGLLSKGARCIY